MKKKKKEAEEKKRRKKVKILLAFSCSELFRPQ
jgi:hypothetical protein